MIVCLSVLKALKVRPCEWYKEEYDDCKSIKARFHQYFVFGKTIECDQWQTDYRNCMDFRKTKSMDSLDMVIKSELNKKAIRLSAAKANNVWEPRNKPPEDWNAPLPDYLEEKLKNSLFLKMTQPVSSEKSESQWNCTIS